MEKNKKKKIFFKIIDYIDDRGNKRRTYVQDRATETYIEKTYSVIKNSSPNKNLTS